jgi:hypothetical protein
MDRIRCATTVSFQNGTPAARMGRRFHVKHIRLSRRRRPRLTWVASPDVPLLHFVRRPSQRISCHHHRRSERGRSTVVVVGCPRRPLQPRPEPRRSRLHRPPFRCHPLDRRPVGIEWRAARCRRPPYRPFMAGRGSARSRCRPDRCRRQPVPHPRRAVLRTVRTAARRSLRRPISRNRPVSRTSGWNGRGMVVPVRFVWRQTGEHRWSSGRRRRHDRFPSPILRRTT